MLATSPSELAPDQTAELMFSQKKTSEANGGRIGPEETELHYTTLHMIIIKNFDLKVIVSYYTSLYHCSSSFHHRLICSYSHAHVMVKCCVLFSASDVPQSVGLHDEINSIIAIVGLCSLSEQL